MLPFSLKESRQTNPLQVPQRGPYGQKYPLTGHFHLSLNISLFIFPSESPVREPPPCSLTGSTWAAIIRHQSHWSSFHSFIHVCLPESQKMSPPTYIWGKTWGHRPRSPTQTEVLHTMRCGMVPQRVGYNTAISTPVPCSLRHDTFHLGLGRLEPR